MDEAGQPLFEHLPGDIRISFEFFPPKTENMANILWRSVEVLAPLKPDFVSVTYGAGGSTRERTHQTVARIQKETGLSVAAHLTCIDASREEIAEIADSYWESGIRHIVALRGDRPAGAPASRSCTDGYGDASALVEGLLRQHPFDISVSCYPEPHPEAISPEADLDHLKRKIDSGASRAISQFFFEPDTFLRFRDRAAAAGIDVPLLPGILPVNNFASVQRMAGMCGTAIPGWMPHLFEGLDERPDARNLVAATVAAAMARRLYENGVRHFHFYTLNRAELSYAICHLLGARP